MVPLGILRETRNSRPSHHDLRQLDRLLPHMRRSIEMYLRFDALELHRRAMEEAVDPLPFGVLLVDGKANVLYLNRTAEAMVMANDGVKVRPVPI